MTPRSSLVTQGRDRSPNRAMLRALGMKGDDLLNHKLVLRLPTTLLPLAICH